MEEDQSEQAPPRQGASYKDEGEASWSLRAAVEAIVFVAREPLSVHEIMLLIGEDAHTKDVKAVLAQIQEEYDAKYSAGNAGFILREIAGTYQFQTVDEASDLMRKIFSVTSRSLSRAAQETLAIVAYRQPLSRAEIEYIRGVDVGSIMKKLLEQELIHVTGRSDHVGKPLLFGTTRKFLNVYNLSSLKDLPPIESFQPSRQDVKVAQEMIDTQK